MAGISTRRARKLRAIVMRTIQMRRNLNAARLDRQKREAAKAVADIREKLTPAYRLQLQQCLAQWEAHLDSLEDDGVYAITKGRE